jgi:hypothetical protein
MADSDFHDRGSGLEEGWDADQIHAPLARVISEVAQADDITRARHLRIALEAFATNPSTSIPPTPHRWHRRIRLSGPIGAVAAAALLVFGLVVVMPLISPQGEQDAVFAPPEAISEPFGAQADSAPADASMSERRSESLTLALAPCTEEIERALRLEGHDGLWRAEEVIEEGSVMLKVEAFFATASDSQSAPVMTLILSLEDCRVLRTERAGP